MQKSIQDLAKHAYCAYGKSMDWKENSDGDLMPEWDQLPPDTRMAWVCAVYAVQQLVSREFYQNPMMVATFSDKHPNEINRMIERWQSPSILGSVVATPERVEYVGSRGLSHEEIESLKRPSLDILFRENDSDFSTELPE
jgi:hypothetical protein